MRIETAGGWKFAITPIASQPAAGVAIYIQYFLQAGNTVALRQLSRVKFRGKAGYSRKRSEGGRIHYFIKFSLPRGGVDEKIASLHW
jgi:hypothetical protein